MEIQALYSLFNQIDTNSDSKISTSEMTKAIKNGIEQEELALFQKDNGKLNKALFLYGAANDKKLSREEFISYWTTTDEEDNTVMLSEEEQNELHKNLTLLSKVDKNGNMGVTASEVNTVYKKAVKDGDQELIAYLEPYMTTNKKGKKIADKYLVKFLGNGAKNTSGGGGLTLKYTYIGKKTSFYGFRFSKRSKKTYYYMTTKDMLSFDKDKNGVLSSEENSQMRTFQSFFETIDRNKNGKISTSEIKKAYKNAAEGSALKQMLSSFVEVNEKGNVKLNKANFRAVSGGDNAITRSDFMKLDSGDNENITKEEVNTFLNSSSLFMQIDKNSNGKISTSEIKKAYKEAEEGSELKEILSNFVTTDEKGKVKVNNANFKALTNGKSGISADDFSKLKSCCDEEISATSIEAYMNSTSEFQTLDKNSDGKLKLSEMQKYAKENNESLLADLFNEITDKKEQKQIFNVISNGQKYITANDFRRIDTDNDGIISEEEINEILELVEA